MAKKHMERGSTSLSVREIQMKTTMSPTSLEGLQSKTQITTRAGEDVEASDPSFTAGGKVKQCNLAILQNVKPRVSINVSNGTPRYIPRRNENMPTQKLNLKIDSYIISNSQKSTNHANVCQLMNG